MKEKQRRWGGEVWLVMKVVVGRRAEVWICNAEGEKLGGKQRRGFLGETKRVGWRGVACIKFTARIN